MSGPRGIGVVQLAGWTPTARAAGGARCTPGPCRGRARGAQPTPGRRRRGAWELGGPCRRVAGALCAGRGVQPRGSTGWTRGRGAEGMAVQAEQTARADVSVCPLPSVEVASSWVLLRRWPRWALLFPTWPRWCCRRQKPVAGWPRSDPDHQPCWGGSRDSAPCLCPGKPVLCPLPRPASRGHTAGPASRGGRRGWIPFLRVAPRAVGRAWGLGVPRLAAVQGSRG